AVSGTGDGEFFIRLAIAHRICALAEFEGLGLQAACDRVVQQDLSALGGHGGVIAVAPDGEMAWSFNTSGMYRARIADGRPLEVAIYKDEAGWPAATGSRPAPPRAPPRARPTPTCRPAPTSGRSPRGGSSARQPSSPISARR